MAKKRFTEGLEDLFSSAAGDSLSSDSPLLRETSPRVKTKSSASAASQSKSSGTSSSGKSFSSDLDDWFRDALRESLEKSLQEPATNADTKSGVGNKKRSIKPKEGLDTLIRQTVETAEVDLNYEKKRRLVVALDQEVLNKLRNIAQREKSYLKDIVNRVVTEFIDQYEKKV